jgi:4-diphosphocytidyl-2-C-methyl-D-erythritol kinase
VRAFAKINLGLRVLDARADGYHNLRTTFQSVALHDTLTLTARAGPLRVESTDPSMPSDRGNLVWRAAERLWHEAGRRGDPRGVHVAIRKRIPLQAGLGGGSSDAAAALRGLARLWNLDVDAPVVGRAAAALGADVPFFLVGGTALGLDRGDLVFPLPDMRARWVVLVVPPFGVNTRDAYVWFDEARAAGRTRLSGARVGPRLPAGSSSHRRGLEMLPGVPAGELRNDLEGPVCARHPELGRIVRTLARWHASHAAMTGSGSAVFGLFDTRPAADRAAAAVAARRSVIVTRTLARRRYQALAHPTDA